MLQQHFSNGCQLNNSSSGENSGSTLAAIFPWVTQTNTDTSIDQELVKDQDSEVQDLANPSGESVTVSFWISFHKIFESLWFNDCFKIYSRFFVYIN